MRQNTPYEEYCWSDVHQITKHIQGQEGSHNILLRNDMCIAMLVYILIGIVHITVIVRHNFK